MVDSDYRFDVIIAGAGPAGSSAAIHLSSHGRKVLLLEQKKFPRQKLCGEFISPECRDHFRKLGVEADMLAASPAVLTETVFYSSTGYKISVPSDWLMGSIPALGLSRADMDHKLMQRAARVGVTVLEEASVAEVLERGDHVSGVRVKRGDTLSEYHSRLTIDATGRSKALRRRLKTERGRKFRPAKARLVAFKVHLRNARVGSGACEIYSYRGGYGGLSSIESGLSNLCFIAAAHDVRRCNSDPHTVVERVVRTNPRAAYALAGAEVSGEWLSVALENFGRQTLVPVPGLISIGDAAAFIDPFTGSGMLMALESGELASEIILAHLKKPNGPESYEALARDYRTAYARKFNSRLRISGLLRRTAFFPYAAEAAILFFSLNDRMRRKVARATRSTPSFLISDR